VVHVIESSLPTYQENQRLKARVKQLEEEIASQREGYESRLEALSQKLSEVTFQLSELRRAVYGRKSERFQGLPVPEAPTPGVATLFDLAPPSAADPAPGKQITIILPAKKKNENHPGRNPLPDHLKREVTVLEPAGPTEGLKVTCREVTEILDYTPGRLFVRRYERPKYGAPGGDGVLVADLPEQPLPKSSCSAALLAHVIAAKYVDSMPLYRQLEGFKRQGVTLAAATVSGWVEGASQLLEPLYEELKSQVLATHYLQVDETRLQVLDHEKKGKSHRGWLWAYHAVQENLVLFDYAPGRDKDPPIKMLQSFQGHLQTDAYGAYDSFSKVPGITMAACWAHARRDFFEAA